MLTREQFLLCQVCMDSGDDSLITQRSSRGLDNSDELRGVFVTRLSEMHFVPSPECASLLAIPCIEVVGRGNELRCWENWLLPPLSPSLPCFKLLLPHGL